LVNPDCSEAIARPWHAEYAIHTWAAHDLPHDDADWLLEVIGDWQQTHSPGEAVLRLG
jgi:hypothetical protein